MKCKAVIKPKINIHFETSETGYSDIYQYKSMCEHAIKQVKAMDAETIKSLVIRSLKTNDSAYPFTYVELDEQFQPPLIPGD